MGLFHIIGGTIVIVTLITSFFSYLSGKEKRKLKELELKKEILQLDIQLQDKNIKLLEEENKKLDKIINE